MSSKQNALVTSLTENVDNCESCWISHHIGQTDISLNFYSYFRKCMIYDLAKCDIVYKVGIAVYSDHIFNGSFVKAMNKAQYSSLVFTQATHLELRLVVEASKVMLQPKGTANAQAFVELVNRMLPAKTSVYVDLEQHVTDNPMLSRRVSEVLGGIFENAQDRRLMQPGMKIPIGAVPPLLAMTSLYFSQAFNWDVTSEFVKRNTATLKSLGFTYFSIKGIATLLSDHQGNNVVYPVLEDLYLGYYSSLNDCHPLIPDNVVFFPVLNKLTFRSKSPVAGYYLFKGNETTLEHLVIDSHVAVVDQLERFGIFNGETFPNLKDIEVSKNVNGFIPVESIASIPDTVYMHVRKRVDNIVPVPIPSAHLKEIVSNAQFMTTTHLHLKNTSLSLSDMVVLLDSLPRVKVVTSYFDGLGAEFSVPCKQIQCMLSAKYTTLNRVQEMERTQWRGHAAPQTRRPGCICHGSFGSVSIVFVVRCKSTIACAARRYTNDASPKRPDLIFYWF